jgi:hypothetical protein
MDREADVGDEYDHLAPNKTNYQARGALVAASSLTIAGLTGFAVSRFENVGSLLPAVGALPHLLGISILSFGVGSGAFAMLVNLFTNSVTLTQTLKASSIFFPLVGLLTALVDTGAFHPHLALSFIGLLSASGVVYAMYYGDYILAADG